MYKLCLMIVCLFACLEARVKQVAYGIEAYKGEKLGALHGYGVLDLEDCKVADTLEVDGDLHAAQCELGKVRIHGRANLENCTVKRKIKVFGALEAKEVQFIEKLIFSGEHLILDGCSVDAILVCDSGKDTVVELRGGTKVQGAITFESDRGVVMKGSEAELLGKVVGGKVE